MTIRGAGGFSLNGDGFLLVDRSCAATHALPEAGERWGSVLLKTDSRSQKGPVMSRFRDAVSGKAGGVYQIVVAGELNCRRIERIRDEVGGKGFGSWGLIPCELSVRRVLALHEVR